MDKELAKSIISKLNLTDFSNFLFALFESSYGGHIKHYDKIDEHVFLRELPMGDFNHEFYDSGFRGIYIIDEIPYELFKDLDNFNIDTPQLRQKLVNIKNDFSDKFFLPGVSDGWHNQLEALYFILNSKGLNEEYYRKILMPKYNSLLEDVGLKWNDDFGLGIGSPDSFLDLNPENCIKVLTDLLNSCDGLAIELSKNSKKIRYSNSEKYLFSGVGHISSSPYNPIFKNNLFSYNTLIQEFENLIQSNPTEKKLEDFLKEHYKDIFGFKYDRIETQMWLNFPQLDINNKNRCLDIFLHNTLISDWELIELKKIIPLTRSYRDIPTLTTEIYTSIQQILNYERLLKQDKVKEYFKREGIEYFEPSLHLIVGKSPTVSTSQWRWLVNTNKSVKLTTYDELIEEMKLRYRERESIINQISGE